jgi:hypothetical protein
MKKIAGFAVALAIVSSMAHAGGPVVVVDEGAPVVALAPASSLGGGALLAGLAGLVLIAAIAGGSDGTDATE